jgi:nucleotide-binding universal stress UspA family protein
MGFKDILVTVDTARTGRARLELAVNLAMRFNAHLVGLQTSVSPDAPQARGYFEYFNRSLDAFHEEFAERMRAEAAAARALFEELGARHSVSAEWRQASGYPSQAATLHGRYADLIVLGQPDPGYVQAPLFQPSPGEVALAVGRPLLVVPYAGTWTAIGRRVMIGWNASREATRAVNDAMPFLVAAETVTVLTIDPSHDGVQGHGDVPGADIAQHLARHGVKATVQSTVAGDIEVGDALLSWVSDVSADLLVMGAYSHSRDRELVFGGATRTVIETMTVPVLMAH